MARVPRVAGAVVVLCAALALCAPAGAPAFEKAFLGPETHDGTSSFPLYKDLGVQVMQTVVNWNAIAPFRPADPTNPNDPAYKWPTGLDQEVAEAQANGIQLLYIVMGTPGWANGGHDDPAWAPTNPQDYADFLTAAAQHYPSVKRWMIWGEPCRVGNFKPITNQRLGHPVTATQKAQVRRYAVILDDAYASLKAADPNNVVIGGNTWSVCDIRPLDWVRYMRLPNGRPPRMDLYGHNPIGLIKRKTPLPAKDHVVELEDLPRLQQYIDRYLGPGSPHRIELWLSEYFLPTSGNPKTNFVIPPSQQASILKQALRIARRTPTVTGFGYDNLFDDPSNGDAGLITAAGVKKPAYAAFKRG